VEGGVQIGGCSRAQKRAMSAASVLSVLVRVNRLLAEAALRAGLTMLTWCPAASRASAKATPYSPVASRQAWTGSTPCSPIQRSRAAKPAGSIVKVRCASFPSRSKAAANLALATAMPQLAGGVCLMVSSSRLGGRYSVSLVFIQAHRSRAFAAVSGPPIPSDLQVPRQRSRGPHLVRGLDRPRACPGSPHPVPKTELNLIVLLSRHYQDTRVCLTY
jgi:hypothetical protein